VKNSHALCLAIIGMGALVALYYAMQTSDGPSLPVPQFQSEAQVMGLNVGSPFEASIGIDVGNNGSNTRSQPHFWVPGLDPCPGATPCVQYTPHRYPSLPGGNISTVMHQGIVEACCNNAPDRDWYFNPPEVAVL
jgi:hypothetical protein